jgi:SAM-dependent methyltransferase
MSYSDIAQRYALIKPTLERYKRPFTVLDLGAFEGAFAFQIARDFPQSTVIAIEQDDLIVGEAKKANLPNVIVLQRKMSAEDIVSLSRCEHFDVVLCLNFLHHMGDQWLTVFDALRECSSSLFVQTPYPQDKEACGQECVQAIFDRIDSCHEPLGETTQFHGHMPRPLYRIPQGVAARIYKSSMESPDHAIASFVGANYNNKHILLLHKGHTIGIPWTYGFNLANFCYLNGKWPTKERVLEMLREMPLPEKQHGDISLHNIIIDGQKAKLIDGGEPWATWDDAENLAKVIAEVEKRL